MTRWKARLALVAFLLLILIASYLVSTTLRHRGSLGTYVFAPVPERGQEKVTLRVLAWDFEKNRPVESAEVTCEDLQVGEIASAPTPSSPPCAREGNSKPSLPGPRGSDARGFRDLGIQESLNPC
jgi:hypothetical protein